MANIRWDTTRNTNDASANQLFSGGGAKIENAISALSKLGRRVDNETIDQNNTDNRAAMRSELDSISNFGTNKGNFANEVLDAKYGKGRYDAEAKNAFLDSQLGNLQAKENTQYAYDQNQLTKAEAPQIQGIQNLIANRDFAGARAAVEGSGIRDTSQLMSDIDAGEQQGFQLKRDQFRRKLSQDVLANPELNTLAKKQAYAREAMLNFGEGTGPRNRITDANLQSTLAGITDTTNNQDVLSNQEAIDLQFGLDEFNQNADSVLSSAQSAAERDIANFPGQKILKPEEQEETRQQVNSFLDEELGTWFGTGIGGSREEANTLVADMMTQGHPSKEFAGKRVNINVVQNALKDSLEENLLSPDHIDPVRFRKSVADQLRNNVGYDDERALAQERGSTLVNTARRDVNFSKKEFEKRARAEVKKHGTLTTKQTNKIVEDLRGDDQNRQNIIKYKKDLADYAKSISEKKNKQTRLLNTPAAKNLAAARTPDPVGNKKAVDTARQQFAASNARQDKFDQANNIVTKRKEQRKAIDNVMPHLIQAESSGNPNAVSPAGAQGLTQVMPATAKNPGYGVKPLSDPFDPVESERFAKDYMGAMMKEFGGDMETALVAYNAGPGNAKKFAASGKDYSVLPKRSETEPYVKKILKNSSPAKKDLNARINKIMGKIKPKVNQADFKDLISKIKNENTSFASN